MISSADIGTLREANVVAEANRRKTVDPGALTYPAMIANV